jgi:hypothetical protein
VTGVSMYCSSRLYEFIRNSVIFFTIIFIPLLVPFCNFTSFKGRGAMRSVS